MIGIVAKRQAKRRKNSVGASETISIRFIGGGGETRLGAFKAYLDAMPHILLSESSDVPDTPPTRI